MPVLIYFHIQLCLQCALSVVMLSYAVVQLVMLCVLHCKQHVGFTAICSEGPQQHAPCCTR
jgi:hypothetical protein